MLPKLHTNALLRFEPESPAELAFIEPYGRFPLGDPSAFTKVSAEETGLSLLKQGSTKVAFAVRKSKSWIGPRSISKPDTLTFRPKFPR